MVHTPHDKDTVKRVASYAQAVQGPAHDEQSLSPASSKPAMAPAPSPRSWLVTAVAILCWYCSNIGVLLLNKYLLSSTGFDNPVFLTLCHMVACVSIGGLSSVLGVTPLKLVKSWQQFLKIVVLAAVFCLTVVLGNVSLAFIPVSFNQAIGEMDGVGDTCEGLGS